MQLRPILLNSEERRQELSREWGVELPDGLVGRLLIELNDPRSEENSEFRELRRAAAFYWLQQRSKAEWLLAPDPLAFPLTRELMGPLTQQITTWLSLLHKPLTVAWQVGSQTLNFAQAPLVMGILNVTPDSFSDGGKYTSVERAVEHALQMEAQGATLIDIGGESTRPGAQPVPEDEEKRRVIPVIEKLRQKTDVLISVDTYKSGVAREALQAGANIVNDISGAQFDAQMVEVVKEFDCPLIIMHIKGTPRDMQRNPFYQDVVREVYEYFEQRLAVLETAGIDKIIIDPGIGFGKRQSDNLHLLRDLKDFTFLNRPILIGTSRKSFIGRILNKEAGERLYGSLATQLIAVQNGAHIVRVHDVGPTVEVLNVLKSVQNAGTV